MFKEEFRPEKLAEISEKDELSQFQDELEKSKETKDYEGILTKIRERSKTLFEAAAFAISLNLLGGIAFAEKEKNPIGLEVTNIALKIDKAGLFEQIDFEERDPLDFIEITEPGEGRIHYEDVRARGDFSELDNILKIEKKNPLRKLVDSWKKKILTGYRERKFNRAKIKLAAREAKLAGQIETVVCSMVYSRVLGERLAEDTKENRNREKIVENVCANSIAGTAANTEIFQGDFEIKTK